MNCPQCAADNMQGSERCWQCGVSLRPSAEPRSQQSWIVWSVVGAVALGAIVMMFSASGGSAGGGSRGTATVTPAAASTEGTATVTGSSTPPPSPSP